MRKTCFKVTTPLRGTGQNYFEELNAQTRGWGHEWKNTGNFGKHGKAIVSEEPDP